ncbi:capsular biosynthesis protein [Agrobacterium vitis]|uniref:Capsular biosynthesis protein n=1 Tax=Agrobacterium vitis TaxID=373 RepID=A0A368NPQ4_AGRVI|nr:capsular biosynthesis protein [Agrobacterium vitis]KAA3529535.1 capsular biosynthesis protein [Agrobacterium vitis]MCF1477476.1 capsular biosynthesis protein [Agrobacterium vitis]MUZ97200.1 capsular biosynthesis protein [Agrobacterium vitis]MVA28210.1 capsular biosynthesis protein [Agrobacterium vitis]
MTKRRTFLFLQGPASPFLPALARALETRDVAVRKVNFCSGDVIFWRKWPFDFFRGRDDAWPGFLERLILRHGITDVLMLGDGRPKHAAAVALCTRLGLRAHIFEHGYLRPDWLTVEPFGMSSQSRFPVDPQAIVALAQGVEAPQPRSPYPSSFLTYALYDLIYHVPNVALGWLLHPRYKAHGPVHPVVEYSGWIVKGLTARRRKAQALRLQQRYLATDREFDFYLFPLQLPGDYQIRRHAPMGDLFRILQAVIHSFARHAPSGSRLLFKTHPIDNGLRDWSSEIARMAERCGIAHQVDVIDGGDLTALIRASRGLVTVNSTVGLTALQQAVPVMALAPAIYDVPGLTHQQSLASFWQAPELPDATLLNHLIHAMTATIQIPGGFIGKQAITDGATAMADRLLTKTKPLAHESSPERSRFRYESELLELEAGALG